MIARAVLILLLTVSNCWACKGTKNSDSPCRENVKTDPLDTLLKQLNRKTANLKSYQAKLEYEVNQPLFETKTLRKGVLYYLKSGKKSKLRINFQTLKQDDEKQQKYIEQYIFDGVWLTKIDYQIEAVQRYQLADPNEHKDANELGDAFELVSRNFPIIGFSKIENLKKQFEINLIERRKGEPKNLVHLHLKVKPDSVYKDDYTAIDFWIDKKLHLPTKIVAVSTEEDIYQIRLLKPKVNKTIDKKVFDFKIPKSFGEPEIFPLKKTKKEIDR